MLDSEFLDQVQEVIAACTHPQVQKAVFSATLPAGAEKVAMSMLRDPIRVVVGLKCVPAPPADNAGRTDTDDSTETRRYRSSRSRSLTWRMIRRSFLPFCSICLSRTIHRSSCSCRRSRAPRRSQRSSCSMGYRTLTAYMRA